MKRNGKNEGNVWEQKQKWLERVMASKLTHAQTRFAFCIWSYMYNDKVESWPMTEDIMATGGFSSSGHFKDFRDGLVNAGAIEADLAYHTKGAKQKNYKYTLNLDWDGSVAPEEMSVAPAGQSRSTSGDCRSTPGASKTATKTPKGKTVRKTPKTDADAPVEAKNEVGDSLTYEIVRGLDALLLREDAPLLVEGDPAPVVSEPVATAPLNPTPPAVAPASLNIEEEYEREMALAAAMATQFGGRHWRTEDEVRENQNVVRVKYGKEPVLAPASGW